MNRRVLLIDDEPDLRTLGRELLEDRGYAVVEAADGAQGLRLLYEVRPDAVILDLGMPGMDGWTALERIRELSDVPVLILSSESDGLARVRALRAGADDFLVKPFFAEELLARIEAVLRRSGARRAGTAGDDGEVFRDGTLTIDFGEHRVHTGLGELELTPLEFRLLTEFVRHPRQVLSHEQLLTRVWRDPSAVAPDQVRLYVGYLRRKLGPERDRIETVRGFGYRYLPTTGQ